MQNFLTSLLVLAMLAAIAGGVLGLIFPSIFRVGQMTESPSRKRIAIISFVAFLVSSFGVGALAPKPTPEEIAARAAADAKAEQEKKAKAELAAKKDAAEKKAKAEQAKKKAQETLVATINAMRVADRMCAEAIIDAGKKVNARGDRYDLYEVSKDAADSCAQAAEDMSVLRVPDDLKDAHKLCMDGELTRAIALNKSAAIFDAGQSSPSELHGLKEDMAAGQAKVLACMGTLFVSARKAGIELGEL